MVRARPAEKPSQARLAVLPDQLTRSRQRSCSLRDVHRRNRVRFVQIRERARDLHTRSVLRAELPAVNRALSRARSSLPSLTSARARASSRPLRLPPRIVWRCRARDEVAHRCRLAARAGSVISVKLARALRYAGRIDRAAAPINGRGTVRGDRASLAPIRPVSRNPHGHGFIAPTSWNSAGKDLLVHPRDSRDAALERLAQRPERVAAEFG